MTDLSLGVFEGGVFFLELKGAVFDLLFDDVFFLFVAGGVPKDFDDPAAANFWKGLSVGSSTPFSYFAIHAASTTATNR